MNVSELKTNQISTLVGTVAFFALDAAPDGWLQCDGSAISRELYPELFAAIGTNYGSGNGSTTFNIPTLGGEFLRCWTSANSVETRNVRSSQSWAIQEIHGRIHRISETFNHSGYTSGVFAKYGGYNAHGTPSSTDYSNSAMADFTASRVVQTSNETRPRNIALLVCIKY